MGLQDGQTALRNEVTMVTVDKEGKGMEPCYRQALCRHLSQDVPFQRGEVGNTGGGSGSELMALKVLFLSPG